MSPPKPVSVAEREVMKSLWELGQATVREIRLHLETNGKTWAHTTVNTLLSRMEQKGLVERDSSGFAHVYAPATSRQDLVQQRLIDLADEYCDGQPVPLMLALVENQKFSDSEIEQFRQLIDRLETSSRPPQDT